MTIYQVKYKTEKMWFWRKLKKVKAEASTNFMSEEHIMFILEDDSSVLIPKYNTSFIFSSDRHKLIQENMHRESNGLIPKN